MGSGKNTNLELAKDESLPEGWVLTKLKYLVNGRLEYGANESADQNNRKDPRYIRITDLGNNGKLKRSTFKSLPYEKAKSYLLKEGDVLFARSGATVGKTFQFKDYQGLACYAGYLIKASPNEKKIISDFLYYFTKSLQYENWKDSIFSQATIQNIGADKYNQLPIPTPPVEQQFIITKFLDQQTSNIDKLIQKKEELIKLLEKQRQAIINEAVTQGLNPQVPMKDSGIDWLGEIPEHWEVVKLKYLLRNNKNALKAGPFGSQLLSAEMEGGVVKVYNQRNIIENNLDIGDNFISQEKYIDLKAFEVQYKDVLLTTRGTIGKCTIIPKTYEKGIIHPCLIRLRLDENKVLNEYFVTLMSEGNFLLEQLTTSSNATTIEVIYSEALKNIFIPLPPIEEQARIDKHLKEKVWNVSELINLSKISIDKLKAFRQSLITEAVTGKIDLREYQTQ